MIVDKNINPERDLYYLGGVLINLIESNKSKEFDYIYLYNLMKSEKDISINLFSLTLDWLFILGLVKNGTKGKIKICF